MSFFKKYRNEGFGTNLDVSTTGRINLEFYELVLRWPPILNTIFCLLGKLCDTALTLKPQTVMQMWHEAPFKRAMGKNHQNLQYSHVLPCVLHPNPKAFLCQRCQIPASRATIQLAVLSYGNWWKLLSAWEDMKPGWIKWPLNPGFPHLWPHLSVYKYEQVELQPPVSHDLVCGQTPPINEKSK